MEIVSLNGSYHPIAIERLTGQLAQVEHPGHCVGPRYEDIATMTTDGKSENGRAFG
jgi:hypothetical protein